jgi:hypothetical protein
MKRRTTIWIIIFFEVKDAYMMLSSLSFGDDDLPRGKGIYD